VAAVLNNFHEDQLTKFVVYVYAKTEHSTSEASIKCQYRA